MFEDKTPEAIKAEILAAIHTSSGLSSMAGGFADGVAGPVAEEISKVYRALESVISMLFVDESSGGYIDLIGRQYHNMSRRSGTRASCKIAFAGVPGLVIERGTGFLTASGLAFTLVEKTVIGANGAAEGRLDAEYHGSAYNVDAGAINRMYVNLPGLTAYANEAASGGTDEESDVSLLLRIRERVQKPPTSGNGYEYRQWAMEISGVGAAKVVELQNGPGTVDVTLVDSNYEAASAEIVSAVSSHISAERPIGASVSVQAAAAVQIAVSASVTLGPGYPLSAVQASFSAALQTYLHSLIDGKYSAVYYKPEDDAPYTLLYHRILGLLLNTDGVEDFSALVINEGTSDVTMLPSQIPVLGEVYVT